MVSKLPIIWKQDLLYQRASYAPLLRTLTVCAEQQQDVRVWLACPHRDANLGEGYGGRYFAAVVSGQLDDHIVASRMLSQCS